MSAQGALSSALKASGQCRPGPNLLRRLLEWNDAFRTLKLIHALRDGGLPSLPLRAALAAAPFLESFQLGRSAENLVQLRALSQRSTGETLGWGSPGFSLAEQSARL